MANEEITETFAAETEEPVKRKGRKAKGADAVITAEEPTIDTQETELVGSEVTLPGTQPDEKKSDEGKDTVEDPDRIVGAMSNGEEEFEEEDESSDMYFPGNESDAPDIEAITQAVTQVIAGIYGKRRVYRATDKERQEMYGRKEKVVAERGMRIFTTEDELKHEYDILLNANRSVPKKIVYGTVSGVCEDKKTGMCVTVNLDDTKGYFKILIPAIELFPMDMKNYIGNENGLTYLVNELRSRIGGHIGFTVYDLNESKRTAYGSRVEAMSIEAYRWYRKKETDGVPKMINGLRAMAEIVSVRRDRVKVHVLGAEATILSKDMSWLSLGVLTDEFRIGQTFPVRVDNITEVDYTGVDDKKYVLISISASKKAAEPNPADLYYDTFDIGDLSSGEIKNVTETGVYVNLQNKMDCLCKHPVSGGVPTKNTPCVVRIDRKSDEKKFLYGTITYMG